MIAEMEAHINAVRQERAELEQTAGAMKRDIEDREEDKRRKELQISALQAEK